MTDGGFPIEVVTGREPTHLRQAHAHYAGANPVGDCFRTCVASLLGASTPHDVPHFVQESIDAGIEDGRDDTRRARLWLRGHQGLDLAYVDLDLARRFEVPFLATVQSKGGPWGHSVVVAGDDHVICPTGTTSYTVEDVDCEQPVQVLTLPYDPDPEELFRRQVEQMPLARPT